MSAITPRLLSAEQVANALHGGRALDLLIEKVASGLKSFSKRDGTVDNPVRTTVPSHGGFLGCMPARCPFDKSDALGVKLVTWYPGNKPPVSTHNATIMLFDPPTGQLLAIMDGEHITQLRTAAVSAAATKALASPDSRILAILGSGAQARSHIELLDRVHKYKEVRVWSRTQANASSLVDECTKKYGEQTRFCTTETAEMAVRDADVVCLCTSSKEPVLFGDWVKRGAHVNAVGACRPDWREMDDALMRKADVYVDSLEGAKAESGDVIMSGCQIKSELGSVLDKGAASQHDPHNVTVFKSLGLAVEDVMAARLVLDLLDSA